MKNSFWFLVLVICLLSSKPILAQWVQTNGPSDRQTLCFALNGTNLFAGTSGGIFLSTNNGTSWTDNGLDSTFVVALAVSGTNLFAGTFDGVFLSTDNGTSWTAVNSGLTSRYVYALAVLGTNLFAGTNNGGVFLSTKNGTSWTAVDSGLTNHNVSVNAFAVSGPNLFAGIFGDGVYLSTNNGTSWTEVNSGLTNPYVYSLATSATNLFVGTFDGGIWRRPLSEMITSVGRVSTDLPTQFSLSQNYPNPFNPSTVINYRLPTVTEVILKVYDVLGRKVETLVNGRQNVWDHSVNFNAGNLPSGIYFYRLQAGTFTQTRKLMVLK